MVKILVRGSGDIGSAVALGLFQAGFGVLIHDEPLPSATRRKMAFTDAVFDGQAFLLGVTGRLITAAAEIEDVLQSHLVIPVTVVEFSELLAIWQPSVLVDARMRKHQQPEKQIDLAALTIGLGPNFTAGKTVHLVVETARGKDLGRVITQGASLPLAGEPVAMDGHARERYVYSPLDGVFQTAHQVGDAVQKDQEVGRVNGVPLPAPLRGLLRGLSHDGVPVKQNTKVIEIDPRGRDAQIAGITDRSAAIAQGVLAAIKNWEISQTR